MTAVPNPPPEPGQPGPAEPPGQPAPPDWGRTRSRTVEWHDPGLSAERATELDGLTFLRAVADGEIPTPPIGALMNMHLVAVDEGTATFALTPDESQYNPIGGVHGGTMCTLLDSVVGCAVHTTLPAGVGYTSVEIKVSFMKAVTKASGTLTAVGRVTKPGRRIAFAEGEVRDALGALVATATSTLLVFELPTR
jgi:uncharacterized protein (TIGR00369 family)